MTFTLNVLSAILPLLTFRLGFGMELRLRLGMANGVMEWLGLGQLDLRTTEPSDQRS